MRDSLTLPALTGRPLYLSVHRFMLEDGRSGVHQQQLEKHSRSRPAATKLLVWPSSRDRQPQSLNSKSQSVFSIHTESVLSDCTALRCQHNQDQVLIDLDSEWSTRSATPLIATAERKSVSRYKPQDIVSAWDLAALCDSGLQARCQCF